MKTIVILNPDSGRECGRKLAPTTERILRTSDLDFDLLQSERPWHTTEIAEAATRQSLEVIGV